MTIPLSVQHQTARGPVEAVNGKSSGHVATRILELDALRGIAALAVVFFHFTTRYDQLFGHSERLPLSISFGDYGVNLFFMLSGFVILMTLERTSDSLKFAWGRLTRLYPAYWAAVALTFLMVMLLGLPGQEVGITDAILNLTMIQALLGAPHVDGAYWSLQAELIFYCNMLLVYRLGAFRWPTATTAIWVSVAALVVASQSLAEYFSPAFAGLLSKVATITSFKYIGMFGLGILVYDNQRRADAVAVRLLAAGCCLASIALRSGLETMLIDAVLASVLWMAVSGRMVWLNARWLTFFGAISYTLYLTHQNIGYIVILKLQQSGVSPALAIVAAFAITLVLAFAVHRLIERPSLRYLRCVDVVAAWGRVRERLLGTKVPNAHSRVH